jgi:hypothetical protein
MLSLASFPNVSPKLTDLFSLLLRYVNNIFWVAVEEGRFKEQRKREFLSLSWKEELEEAVFLLDCGETVLLRI